MCISLLTVFCGFLLFLLFLCCFFCCSFNRELGIFGEWPTTPYCSSGWDQRGLIKEISSRGACCRPTTDVIWALLKAQRHWKARRLTSSALWWLATTCVSVVSFTKVATRLVKLRNPECHYDPRPLAAAPPVTGPATAPSRKGGTLIKAQRVTTTLSLPVSMLSHHGKVIQPGPKLNFSLLRMANNSLAPKLNVTSLTLLTLPHPVSMLSRIPASLDKKIGSINIETGRRGGEALQA